MIKFFLSITLWKTLSLECQRHQALVILNQGGFECKDCSENCNLCSETLDNHIKCLNCNSGYFLNLQNECEKCYDLCEYCLGPSLEECQQLSQGYYYNIEDQKVQKIKIDGCQSVNNQGKCLQCKRESVLENIQKEIDNGENQTNQQVCKKCSEYGWDNCEYCSHDDKTKQVQCILCDIGFGIVDNKCEKCLDNCEYCQGNEKLCSICSNGYLLDQENNICFKPQDQNCNRYVKDKCVICQSGFYKSNEGVCQTCSTKLQGCNYCTQNEINFSCLQCKKGYYLSEKNQCEKCSENCIHCTAKQCDGCVNTHFLPENEKECQLCSIENCEFCDSSTQCKFCKPGYYFNSQNFKCEKCKNNCLVCDDSGEQCFECPIDFILFEKEIIQKKKMDDLPRNQETVYNKAFTIMEDFLQMAFGQLEVNQIEVKRECVKQCPTIFEGQNVIYDSVNQRCQVQIDKSAPLSQLHQIKDTDSIISSIMKLKMSYFDEINKIIQDSLAQKNANYSKICNYNGKLYYYIDQKTSYYYCRCKKGYIGDNCEVTFSLYHNTQNQLLKLLNKLEKELLGNKDYTQTLFFEAMMQLNNLKQSMKVIGKVIALIEKEFIYKRNIFNKDKLYITFDSVLLNCFDLLEDFKKENFISLYTIDEEHQKILIKGYINKTLSLLEESFQNHSFNNMENKNIFEGLKTNSFKIFEFTHENFKNNILEMEDPQIDTEQMDTQKIKLKLIPRDTKMTKIHLQTINFSYKIFEDIIRSSEKRFMSNILFLRLIKSEKGKHKQVKNIQLQKLEIDFPLIYLPMQLEIEKQIQCEAFKLELPTEFVLASQIYFNEKLERVVCVFEGFHSFDNTYFAVTSKQLIIH